MRNTLEIAKYVKVMADFDATGVWGHGGDCVDVRHATQDPELIEKIVSWQKQFDSSDPFAPMDDMAMHAHLQVALEIAHMLKKEHPKWHVCVHDNGFFKGTHDKKGNFVVDLPGQVAEKA